MWESTKKPILKLAWSVDWTIYKINEFPLT